MTQDITTVTITGIGANGDGIGTHGGKPVYVPKTMTGDTVRVRIEHSNAQGHQARLVSVVSGADGRAIPPCPHFIRCGGCSLQHLPEDAYRDWKITRTKATLEQAGIIPEMWEEPIFIPAATRRRTTLAAFKNGKDIRLGYHEPRSNNILSIETCPVLEPLLEQTIAAMRPYLPHLLPERKAVDITLQNAGGLDLALTGAWHGKGGFSFDQMQTLTDMAEALNIARISVREKEFSEAEVLFTRAPIIKHFGTLCVALPPAAFLQASSAGENALVQTVIRHIKDARNIADLFSGCGTFTGHFLETGAHVHAVDGDAAAIHALAATTHPKLSTQKRNLFKNPLTVKDLEKFDAVVFDPPRAGAKEQAEILAHAKIPLIIGVSCNPASFARDAKILQNGGYALKSLTLVDQFVWSTHAELIGIFDKIRM